MKDITTLALSRSSFDRLILKLPCSSVVVPVEEGRSRREANANGSLVSASLTDPDRLIGCAFVMRDVQRKMNMSVARNMLFQ